MAEIRATRPSRSAGSGQAWVPCLRLRKHVFSDGAKHVHASVDMAPAACLRRSCVLARHFSDAGDGERDARPTKSSRHKVFYG